jgi:gamma-glutamylcyclotransferase (GGCT)/AIG2-like uncharacterized protein YtfP
VASVEGTGNSKAGAPLPGPVLVFVYGTLTDPDRVDAVLEDWSFAGDAVLAGLARAEGRYPTLVPPGDDASRPRVEGRLLRTPDVDALDDYEGVDRGLYVRVTVPLSGWDGKPEDEATVYVGDPDRLGVDASWPTSGPVDRRVRRFLAERDVVIRPSGGR